MIIGIKPTVDYAFKHTFGRESTKPLLIDVLNQVLQSSTTNFLSEVELMNPLNQKEALDDKLSILDIKARDQSKRQFNIEMQILAFRHYEKRILYYGTRLHQHQLQEGEAYGQLKPTISVSFLDFVLFPQVSDHHLCFRLLEKSHQFPLTSDLEFHILELPKFKRTAAELETGLDVWLYFLRNAETMDIDNLPPALQQPLVLRAFEELKMLALTELEREKYESRRKAQMDYISGMSAAREEGLEEGLEKGLEKGLRKGIEEGIERGQKKGKIADIQNYERLLGIPGSPVEQLASIPIDALARRAEELLALLIDRK